MKSKKFISLLLAVVLCLSITVAASAAPSVTTKDLTQFAVAAPKKDVAPVEMAEAKASDPVAQVCKDEIAKLKDADVVEYFGEVKDANGKAVDLTEKLGSSELKVQEMCAVTVKGYESGSVKVTMKFSTPYEAGEKVVVLIGLVGDDGAIEWIAVDGTVLAAEDGKPETEGRIQIELSAKLMEKIGDNTVLVAVVSK